MDKILLINKEKGYTSRDVVNIIGKHFKMKKVGHFGTLDPLATGLLVIGTGALTKLDNYDLFDKKEYIATVLVGTKTDTYDILGNTLSITNDKLEIETIKKVVESFKKTYVQEVPIYSAVKVNGKKLYEYARNNEKVILPKKEVTIYDIKYLDSYNIEDKQYFKFWCSVSKGTYIRSIINDISNILNVPMCMSNLERTKVGKFSIENAYTIEDIKNNNYKLYNIDDVLNLKRIPIPNDLNKKIINGSIIDDLGYPYILFTDSNGNDFVLYKQIKDGMKPAFFLSKKD